ncbi:MAG: hypothetical protein ACRD4I_17440, partial [Candidatus Angelobacter sp.]
FGRRRVRIFHGALEQLVEFFLEHLAVRFVGFEIFAEDLFAPRARALEFDDFGGEVIDWQRFDVNGVGDYGAGFGIDL